MISRNETQTYNCTIGKNFIDLFCCFFFAPAELNLFFFGFRERHRRHKIVRRHGLILPNRTRSWLAKYTKALSLKNATESRMHTGRFVAFMQLLTGIEFDRIVEGLQYEVDLRKFILKLVFDRFHTYISSFTAPFHHKNCMDYNLSEPTFSINCRLYELRANGITTRHGGQIYQNMKVVRSNKTSNSKQQSLDIDWKYLIENDTLTGTEQMLKHCIDLNQLPKKRKSTPLNIIGTGICHFGQSTIQLNSHMLKLSNTFHLMVQVLRITTN